MKTTNRRAVNYPEHENLTDAFLFNFLMTVFIQINLNI